MGEHDANRPAPVGRLATAAATLSGNLYLVVGTLVFGLAAVATGWIPPRGRLFSLCARWWSIGLLLASGVRLSVEGEADLRRGQAIFMANHQSLFDIPVLLASLPFFVQFMAKRELFRIPLFGLALRVGGFIPVDRRRRSSARDTYNLALERLAGGASILIFPEETRSLDGSLLPFKRGGFLLALKSGVPVVPVGIEGTAAVQPKSRWTISPGRVTVRYGAPVGAEELSFKDRGDFAAEVRAQIAALAGIAQPAAGGRVGSPAAGPGPAQKPTDAIGDSTG